MGKVILAAVLGAVVLFIWGFASWMFIPWHNATMQPMPDEQATFDLLSKLPEGKGVYSVKRMDDPPPS